MFKPSKRTVAVTTATFMIAGGGVAFAYWTQGGSGTGSASTGTTTALTIEQTNPSASNLVPGGAPQTIALKITNPGDSPVKVAGVNVAVNFATNPQADANKPACTAADFDIVQSTFAGEIAGGDFATTSATIALKNTEFNQDNCKDLSSVPLAFSSN